VVARIYGVSPFAMARVIRAVNANHPGGLHRGRSNNAVIGSPDYLEHLLDPAEEKTAAGSGRYSRR
jgi:hypothetical protein